MYMLVEAGIDYMHVEEEQNNDECNTANEADSDSEDDFVFEDLEKEVDDEEVCVQ